MSVCVCFSLSIAWFSVVAATFATYAIEDLNADDRRVNKISWQNKYVILSPSFPLFRYPFPSYFCCRAAFVPISLSECTIFIYIFLVISHTLSSTSAWNDGRYTRYFQRFNNRNGVVDICIITFYRDKTSKHCPFFVGVFCSLSIYCWFSCHCLVHTKYVAIHWIGISFGLAIKQTVDMYYIAMDKSCVCVWARATTFWMDLVRIWLWKVLCPFPPRSLEPSSHYHLFVFVFFSSYTFLCGQTFVIHILIPLFLCNRSEISKERPRPAQTQWTHLLNNRIENLVQQITAL